MIELDVYQWLRDCYQCDSPTPVVWADYPGSPHSSISMTQFGEAVAELDCANVKRQFSQTRDEEVWGNVCIECGAYQGNHHVHETMILSKVHTDDPQTTITVAPTCECCEESEGDRFEQSRPLCESCTMKELFEKYKNE